MNLSDAIQTEMSRAMYADNAKPMLIFADGDFMYFYDKEMARWEAREAAKARGAWRLRIWWEGWKAYRAARPEGPPPPQPITGIERDLMSWWKNKAAP